MEALIKLAREFEDRRRKLHDEYNLKAENLGIFNDLMDEIDALVRSMEPLKRYADLCDAYHKQKDEIAKQVLMEKLQQIYKDAWALQTKIAKMMQYERPEIVDVETMLRDIGRLTFLEVHIASSLKAQLRSCLKTIQEIQKLTEPDDIMGLQITGSRLVQPEDMHDTSFLKMTKDEIDQYNAVLKIQSDQISQKYNEQVQKHQEHRVNKMFTKLELLEELKACKQDVL